MGRKPMKVIIGNEVHDSGQEPIMIILSATEKDDIKKSDFSNDVFLHYPTDMDKSKLQAFKRKAMDKS